MARKIDSKLLSYNEASGVISYYTNSKIKLNKYGEYEEKFDEATVNGISPNYTDTIDESVVSKELFGEVKGIQFDKRIGYYKSLYIGHVADAEARKDSSSGGVATWILKELFKRNLVDGVIHVKETHDASNIMFSYQISRNLEEIQDGAKTKYYPVEMSEVLKMVKERPGRYAVVGIPSFIYALHLLGKKDPVIGDSIKYTIGLICGHQKSSTFADFMGWQLGFKPGDMTYINFRKKLPDRPSSEYGIEVHGYINGKYTEKIAPKADLLGQDWGQAWFKVFASDYTDDVFNETADIVLGDAWLPGYTNDSDGNNVVIVRNEIINKIITEAMEAGELKFDVSDKDTIFNSQRSGYRHTYSELPYRLYKRQKEGMEIPKKRVEPANTLSFKRRKIQDMREEISISSHIYFKEAVEKDDLKFFLNKMTPLSKKYYRFYKISGLPRRIVNKLKKIF